MVEVDPNKVYTSFPPKRLYGCMCGNRSYVTDNFIFHDDFKKRWEKANELSGKPDMSDWDDESSNPLFIEEAQKGENKK